MALDKVSAQLKKYVVTCILGNGLEWYDFAIFGYFSPIISKQFFPSASVFESLINTFAVFAVGFLSRPFGAYLFGQIGDQKGRKQAILWSMLLMAVSTFLMGLLPTHEHIGVAAPILLTVLRILQGISIGGEYSSTMTFLGEHSPPERRGLIGAWAYSGGLLGGVLGAVAGTLMTLLFSPQELYDWGWRIPFLFGVVVAILASYMRLHCEETPLFLELKKTGTIEKAPFKKVINEHLKEIFLVIGIILPTTVWLYMLFVFLPTYYIEVLNWNISQSFALNLVVSIFVFLLTPFAGHLSDIYGRKFIMLGGLLVLTILTPTALQFLFDGSFAQILLAQVIISSCFALSYGPKAAFVVDLFPGKIRSTGMALSYNIAGGVFGGLTPLILTVLISWSDPLTGSTLWIVSMNIIGLLALILAKEKQPENISNVESFCTAQN